jgi:hypothetical protein
LEIVGRTGIGAIKGLAPRAVLVRIILCITAKGWRPSGKHSLQFALHTTAVMKPRRMRDLIRASLKVNRNVLADNHRLQQQE